MTRYPEKMRESLLAQQVYALLGACSGPDL